MLPRETVSPDREDCMQTPNSAHTVWAILSRDSWRVKHWLTLKERGLSFEGMRLARYPLGKGVEGWRWKGGSMRLPQMERICPRSADFEIGRIEGVSQI